MIYLILVVIVIIQAVRYVTTIGDPSTHLQASIDACICLMVFLNYETYAILKKK